MSSPKATASCTPTRNESNLPIAGLSRLISAHCKRASTPNLPNSRQRNGRDWKKPNEAPVSRIHHANQWATAFPHQPVSAWIFCHRVARTWLHRLRRVCPAKAVLLFLFVCVPILVRALARMFFGHDDSRLDRWPLGLSDPALLGGGFHGAAAHAAALSSHFLWPAPTLSLGPTK